MTKETAMKILKELHDNSLFSNRTALETIIPELKESKDETIRKEIIEFVDINTLSVDERHDRWIAWLEKQCTPAKLSEEEQNSFAKGVLSRCALSFIDYLDAHSYEGKMCVSNGECEDIENAFHNAMWDRLHRYYCKYIEKQGEQKSIEENNGNNRGTSSNSIWSDEDEIEIHFGAKDSELQEETYYIPDGFHAEIDDDKVVIKKGEKSAAWNVEDSSKVQRICKYLDEAKKYYADITEVRECMDWLKSLKDRVQPKPKEWGEEDENYLQSAENACEYQYGKNTSTILWLKSLKNRIGG